MNWKTQHKIHPEQPFSLQRLLILATFFLAGILSGQIMTSHVLNITGEELQRYLSDYVRLGGGVECVSVSTFFSTFVVYFRYPFLAFFLGFTSIGAVALPCVTMVFGFFLSFSVCCFVAAFGVNGILLSLAFFGLRCIVTLTCYFLLAVVSWRTSIALAMLSLGNRSAPIHYGKRWWIRVVACMIVLFLGVCMDMFLSQRLLQIALRCVIHM